jgi:hypothetical protein
MKQTVGQTNDRKLAIIPPNHGNNLEVWIYDYWCPVFGANFVSEEDRHTPNTWAGKCECGGGKVGWFTMKARTIPATQTAPCVQNVSVAEGAQTQMKKFHYYEYTAAEYGRTVLNFTQVSFVTSECSQQSLFRSWEWHCLVASVRQALRDIWTRVLLNISFF